MRKKVFISYAREDRALVLEIKGLLEKYVPCWIDTLDIMAGVNYRECIAQAIDNCEVVLLFVSPNSNDSMAVLSEVLLAKERGKRIVAVRLCDTLPSSTLMELIHFADQVSVNEKNIVAGVTRLRHALVVVLFGVRIAYRSRVVAVVLSLIPGLGCLYLGLKRVGFLLLSLAMGSLIASYPLELGTRVDVFLAAVFSWALISSIVVTVNLIAYGCNYARLCKHRWLPYVLSIVFPGSGIMLAGRWRVGLCFMISFLVAMGVCCFSGSIFVIRGYPLDVLGLHCIWLLGIGESGFLTVKMRHRNLIIYLLIIIVMILEIISFLYCLRLQVT